MNKNNEIEKAQVVNSETTGEAEKEKAEEKDDKDDKKENDSQITVENSKTDECMLKNDSLQRSSFVCVFFPTNSLFVSYCYSL